MSNLNWVVQIEVLNPDSWKICQLRCQVKPPDPIDPIFNKIA